MSTHAIPADITQDQVDKLYTLCVQYVRTPSGMVYGNGTGAVPTGAEFTPDLSGAELSTLADLLALCRANADWAPADYAVFKAQRATLAAYMSGNPTSAQTVAALRALIRVVNAIVRTE